MCKSVRSWLHSAVHWGVISFAALARCLSFHGTLCYGPPWYMSCCGKGILHTRDGILRVHYVRGILPMYMYVRTYTTYGVRAIWIACSVHSVSYLPGPQVSLTVTGCVLRGILAFTDPPPCQPLFASQEMERAFSRHIWICWEYWERITYWGQALTWPVSRKAIGWSLMYLKKGKIFELPDLLS